MSEHQGLLYSLALFKQRYTRGTSWTQILLNFGIITANAKLFEDFFSIHFGLTLPMVLALAVPCYILVCYIIGHYDERSGFWQMENNLNASPPSQRRCSPASGRSENNSRKIPEHGFSSGTWSYFILNF